MNQSTSVESFPNVKRLYLLCIFLFLASSSINNVYAETTTNPSFHIEQIEIDTQNQVPIPSITIYPLTHLENMQPLVPSTKYTVYSSNDAFSITNSQSIIDFGALSATNPVTRNATLSLRSPLQGAQIISNENRPMTATNKQFVPDTTCDKGNCTASLPALWESSLTYGFGYRCESSQKGVCDRSFSPKNSFKQFADASNNEPFQNIVTSSNSKQITTANILYKINISGTQPLGGYRNTINIIAIPNF